MTHQTLSREEWTRMASEPSPPLLALWADTREVYALLGEDGLNPKLVSTTVEAGGYPGLSPVRPLALWFERMIQDLWGHAAIGTTDQRPWLDHGTWPHSAPMALRPGLPSGSSEFLESPAEDWDTTPIGPVRGLIEPAAHLRLFGHGESIARLEMRLGYTHKGTLTLMRGKSPRAAARFAARLCGEATVAHAIAFAHATEAALNIEVPPRGVAWRGVMAELERIAAHLDALTAVAEAVGSELPATRCSRHCEALRRAAEAAFGHRLMMDCVVPGGVAIDIASGGGAAIANALTTLARALPKIERLIPLSGHLAGIGVVGTGAVAACGVAARAAGRPADLRVTPGYAPYAVLSPSVPTLAAGDAAARMRVRLMEISESIRLVRERLATLPKGSVSVPLPPASGEGIGSAEGPDGDVWHWLRLDHGQIASVFMRDPSWLHWRLLQAMMASGQADDLKLTMASLGLSSSGTDL